MKSEFLKVTLIIWLTISTGYFFYDNWNDYKEKGMQQAYQTGKSETIQQLIDEVKKNGCNNVQITKEQQEINIVDATCLNQTQQETQQQFPEQNAQ